MPLRENCVLVVVGLEPYRRQVEESFSKMVGKSWCRNREVEFLSIPHSIRRSQVAVTEFVGKNCAKMVGLKCVLVYGDNGLCEFQPLIPDIIVSRARVRAEFARKLKNILELLGLDLVQRVTRVISSWNHSKIDCAHVNRWLRQFSLYSTSAAEVGRILLDVIVFHPSYQCAANLRLDAECLEKYDWIAVFDARAGRSAAFIKNLAKHQIEKVDINHLNKLTELATKLPTRGSYLVLEDCIYSGSQVANFVGSSKRVYYFDDEYQSGAFSLTIRCGIVTRLGLLRIQEYFRRRDFKNVQIEIPPEGMIENVSNAGLEADRRGELFDDELNVRNYEAYVIPEFILRCKELSLTGGEINALRQVCAALGGALMSEYVAAQSPGVTMPSSWVYGAYGLGMVTVFAHSVATSCLPVIARGGTVRRKHRTIDWAPLFS